mgnify:CR=1 FL=1
MSYPVGIYSEDTLELQKALLEIPITVGPQGADGKMGDETIKAIIIARDHFNLSPPGPRIDVKLFKKLGLRTTNPRKELPMETVLANVKSAWLSKLNWTVAAGVLFNLFMFFGHPVPPDIQANVIQVGNGVVLIAAWVIKTWFTTSITPQSAKKL